MEDVKSILQFWFGTATDDLEVAEQCAKMWWKKNPQVDAEIRDRFSGVVDAAASGQCDAWLNDAHGRLAMIILADQFPRNMYRDTPRAFDFDSFALSWTKDGIASAADQSLRPIERIFFYMPLEHSESVEDQQRAVALTTDLAAKVSPEKRELFEGFAGFAKRHFDIVQRFGRFPHRNAILGRSSTPEEEAFLKQPGSSF